METIKEEEELVVNFMVSYHCESKKNNSVCVLVNCSNKETLTSWGRQVWFSLNVCKFEFLKDSTKYGKMTVPTWLMRKKADNNEFLREQIVLL